MDFLDMAIAKKLGGGGGPAPSGTKQISITENGTTTEDVAAFASVEITVDVPTGGGGTEAPENDVIFYDYDGTRVYSYSATDFANLTAMPANPDHTADGLTAQGWNWSLADAKAYVAEYGMLDIGQMYITTSGATEIDIELRYDNTSVQTGISVSGTVEIDWGDQTEASQITGNNILRYAQHIYAKKGSYKILLRSVSGTFKIEGTSNGCALLTSPTNTRGASIRGSILSVRIGAGCADIGDYAFAECYSLKSVMLPPSINIYNGNRIFYNCYALSCIVIPTGVTTINGYLSSYGGVESISIPKSVHSINNNALENNSRLKRIALSNLSTFGTNVFSNNYLLRRATIGSAPTIGSNSFSACKTLETICLPQNITEIGLSAFSSCGSVIEMSIPSSVENIMTNAFNNMYGLKYLHFNSLTPPTIATGMFNNLTGLTIYVPAESLEAYQTATNWSAYASQIQGE